MTDLLDAPSLEQVLEALDAVVAERGEDYVYPQEWRRGGVSNGLCRYVTPDGAGPACIVAAVLVRFGTPLERLSECEGQSADYVLTKLFGLSYISYQSGVLTRAQGVQDSGRTWGQARDEARELGEWLLTRS